MNTLSYGLLGLLTSEPLAGYDLMHRMNLFWHTSHSHIYPLLAKLQQHGYVEYTLIEQTDKPDKKVYSITHKGLGVVKEWLHSSTDEPVSKDEMILKTFCIHILDKESVKNLLHDRKKMYENQLVLLEKDLAELNDVSNEIQNITTPFFGKYVILKKKISEVRLGIEWCDWVHSLYDNPRNLSSFDNIGKVKHHFI